LMASGTLAMIGGILLLATGPLMMAGLFIGIPAMLLGLGFIALAAGFKALNKIDLKQTLKTSLMLIPIGAALVIAGTLLLAAGIMLGPAALIVAPSLWLISLGLNAMSEIDPAQLMLMSTALIVFAGAMSIIGLMFLNPFMTVGFAGMAAGLMGIGLGLLFINTEKIEALQNLVDKFTTADHERINMIADAIERIAEAIDNVPPFQTLMLGYMFQKLNEIDAGGSSDVLSHVAGTFETIATMPPESGAKAVEIMEGITGLIDAASDAAEAKWFGDQTAIVLDKVKELMGAASGGGGGGGGTEVKLYMDRNGRKEFAKGIISDLTPEINRKLNIVKGPTAG